MTLRDVKLMAAQLRADDLRRLDQWIHDRLEAVRCGKAGCHCNEGQAHGPYWYGYRKEGGRIISKYIGKDLTKARK